MQWTTIDDGYRFYIQNRFGEDGHPNIALLAKNDGFADAEDFEDWFRDYPLDRDMAILHFTDFRY